VQPCHSVKLHHPGAVGSRLYLHGAETIEELDGHTGLGVLAEPSDENLDDQINGSRTFKYLGRTGRGPAGCQQQQAEPDSRFNYPVIS